MKDDLHETVCNDLYRRRSSDSVGWRFIIGFMAIIGATIITLAVLT